MSDQKHDQVAEQLSCMLDGELSTGAQDTMARKLADNARLRRQFGRYQRISSGVQKLPEDTVDAASIVDRVSAALADEPVVLAPRNKPQLQVPRMALGAALAATVAAIAIGLAPNLMEPAPGAIEDETPVSFAFSPALTVPKFSATTVSIGGDPKPVLTSNFLLKEGRWKTLKPEAQKKLDQYLLEHSEYAGRFGVSSTNAHMSFLHRNDAQD